MNNHSEHKPKILKISRAERPTKTRAENMQINKWSKKKTTSFLLCSSTANRARLSISASLAAPCDSRNPPRVAMDGSDSKSLQDPWEEGEKKKMREKRRRIVEEWGRRNENLININTDFGFA